jgi:hypothetical protein
MGSLKRRMYLNETDTDVYTILKSGAKKCEFD